MCGNMCFCSCPTVKEKLTADPDSEIATTSLRVSLLCPVSIFFIRSLSQIHKYILSFMVLNVCTSRGNQPGSDENCCDI